MQIRRDEEEVGGMKEQGFSVVASLHNSSTATRRHQLLFIRLHSIKKSHEGFHVSLRRADAMRFLGVFNISIKLIFIWTNIRTNFLCNLFQLRLVKTSINYQLLNIIKFSVQDGYQKEHIWEHTSWKPHQSPLPTAAHKNSLTWYYSPHWHILPWKYKKTNVGYCGELVLVLDLEVSLILPMRFANNAF